MSIIQTLENVVSGVRKIGTTATLLLLAACASNGIPTAPEARKLNGHDVDEQQQFLQTAKSDNHYNGREISQIISRYDMLKRASMVDGAGDGEKSLFEQVKKEYKGAVDDIFNHTDLYMVLTGVDTAEFQNVPANIGASKPLYLGKGQKYADKFTDEQKEAIVRKAHDAFTPYAVTRGVVQAGGGRLVGIEATCLEIDLKKAGELVGDGITAPANGFKSVSKTYFGELTDGKKENGEASRAFVTAVTPSGYNLPAPEVKK